MNIVVFEVEAWETERFLPLREHHEVKFVKEPLTAENARQFGEADIIAPFIYSAVGREVLKQLPRLKLIATRSTGFDHIDTDFCEENGVQVCNVPSTPFCQPSQDQSLSALGQFTRENLLI